MKRDERDDIKAAYLVQPISMVLVGTSGSFRIMFSCAHSKCKV